MIAIRANTVLKKGTGSRSIDEDAGNLTSRERACPLFQRAANNRSKLRQRSGMATLEVVMTIAVMLPVAGALLFTGIKICAALYQTIGTLVSWPFL